VIGRGLVRCLWLPIAGLSGCGYSVGSLARRDFRRVHLPIFENRTFYRDVEIQLTHDVETELVSRPGFFIVPLSQADIVLEGTIEDLRQRVLSEGSEDQVRESSATTRVRVALRNARTGAVLKEYEVSDRAEFFVPEGEDLGTATDESFKDLARKIVNGLETDFPRSSGSPEPTDDKETADV